MSVSKLEPTDILSVLQLGKSAVTRLYLVRDGGDVADTEVACDFSFSGTRTTDSPDTIIRGYIGSKATVKFLKDGQTLFLSTYVINIQMVSLRIWETFNGYLVKCPNFFWKLVKCPNLKKTDIFSNLYKLF